MLSVVIKVPDSINGKVDLQSTEVEAEAAIFNSSRVEAAQKIIDKEFG
jgi:hypothetical protein